VPAGDRQLGEIPAGWCVTSGWLLWRIEVFLYAPVNLSAMAVVDNRHVAMRVEEMDRAGLFLISKEYVRPHAMFQVEPFLSDAEAPIYAIRFYERALATAPWPPLVLMLIEHGAMRNFEGWLHAGASKVVGRRSNTAMLVTRVLALLQNPHNPGDEALEPTPLPQRIDSVTAPSGVRSMIGRCLQSAMQFLNFLSAGRRWPVTIYRRFFRWHRGAFQFSPTSTFCPRAR
jgi:hypothetical protein